MKHYILILLLSILSNFGKIAHATETIDITLHSGIEALQKKGLTGKGVKVAVFDDFFDEHSDHGKAVVSILRKVAPNVEVIEANTAWDFELSDHIYTLRAENKSKLNLSLKLLGKEFAVDGYHQGSNLSITFPGYYGAQDYNQESSSRKFEEISFPPNTKLTLKVIGHGPFAELSYEHRNYYISLHQFSKRTKPPSFWDAFGEWNLSCDSSIATSPLDDWLATLVDKQTHNGVKIINFSRSFCQVGLKTVEAINEFTKQGGAWISAAGNNPIAYQTENQSSKFLVSATEIDVALLLNVPHLSLLQSNSFLVVGALCRRKISIDDYTQTRASYSALAGVLKDNFIMALADGTESSADGTINILSGTSYAAPQVTGVIALLQEAYPYTPQMLADAIRQSAVTGQQMPKLSNGDMLSIYQPSETGRGAMNPEGAFHLLSQHSVTKSNSLHIIN